MIIVWRNGHPSHYSSSNQYDGSKTGGELDSWLTFTPDANDFITLTYGDLCDRNATLYHVSAIARACVNKPLIYSIGDGLVFRSMIDADAIGISRNKAKKFSQEFTRLLHFEKLHANYYEKQALLKRGADITGDALLYLLREDGDDKPFDLIVEGGHGIDWTANNDDYILGVRMDAFNRRQGIKRTNNRDYIPFRDENGDQNVVQFLHKELAGQARGYGAFYSSIALAKKDDRVWDATIERMVQEAILLGYHKGSTTDLAGQAAAMARASAGKSGKSGNLEQVSGAADLKPGTMFALQNDEAMEFTDLKTPSNNFAIANEWIVRRFSMARGYSPEFIRGEYTTSYTAHKGAFNDSIKKFMQERATFARIVDDVVNYEYLKHFIRTGQLAVRPAFWTDYRVRRAYLSGVHLGPVPGHINPVQEVNADIKAVGAAFTTRAAIAAKYGNDFEPMLNKWEADEKAFKNASPEDRISQVVQDMEARDAKGQLPETLKAAPQRQHFIFGGNK